jgi:hypothetical protein
VYDYARITLACIRMFNGVTALFVPATLARRLGGDPEANPAAPYALRLVGVRTVLIGAQLLRDGGLRAHFPARRARGPCPRRHGGADHQNYNYRVPVFHGLATEDEHLKWDYYVGHYPADEQQHRDSKFVHDRNGVLFIPRQGRSKGVPPITP